MKITIAYENGPASPLLTPIVIGVHYGTIAADDVVLLTGWADGVKGEEVSDGGWKARKGDGGSMKRDEMVLNGTSLSVCARGMVVLRPRRDAGWMDSF